MATAGFQSLEREASLQRSTEQQASYIAKTSAALHWSCITAQPYEQQISIGVTAMSQSML